MQKEWEVTQLAKKLPVLKDPVLIEGLPGIGNVGKIAVDFLVEELDAKPLFSFFSYKYPHSVFVNEKNLVDMPKLELYYKQFGPRSKKRDILFLVGDIQPLDEQSCYRFCDEIISTAKEFGCKEIVTTGGIGLQEVPDVPRVYCTGNSPSLHREYTKKEVGALKKIFGVVGPIVGVSGVLLGLSKRRSVKAVSLLAETFSHPMFLGIKGAKEILHILERRFKWGSNVKKMSDDVEQLEKKIAQKTKEWMAEMHSAQAGAQGHRGDANYIG